VSVPDDAYMSQVHARVYMDDGDVFVEDLNSTNGTFINGEQVHGTRQLFHGDRLQVGHTVLEAD
jgi:pSer/pThr/pTyr-binding forkhead associated (FHA) protein